MVPLTPDQRRALVAVGDTFLQKMSESQESEILSTAGKVADIDILKAYLRTTASDLGVVEAVEKELMPQMRPDVQALIVLVLKLLSSCLGTSMLLGVCGPFADLSIERRERALWGLRDSCIGEKRKIFQQLKSIVFLFAFNRNTASVNPHNCGIDPCVMWEATGYLGPDKQELAAQVAKAAGRDEHIFTTLNSTITMDSELHFDVVIVGSGCGGSVVAAELAQAGHSVLLLEKGRYWMRSELSGEELQGFSMMDRAGTMYTEDMRMAILAGNAFGGGTMVNWACCLKPPESVKMEWAKEFGLQQFADEAFEASLDAVWKRLSVSSGDSITHNRSNQLLMEGCKRLGYPVSPTGQNMADTGPSPPGAGFICNGDRHGLKQSMQETYLRDAATALKPAQVLDRCYVERVLHKDGVAIGVKAQVAGAQDVIRTVTIKAPIVVVSGGSMQSPALLLRSGLPNRHGQIGKNLHLHPVCPTVGFMEDEVVTFRGAPMTAVHTVPADDGYSCKIEVPAVHMGMTSAIMPWQDAQQYKALLMSSNRAVPFIAILRDKTTGEVRVDKDGHLHVHYPISEHTESALIEGVTRAVRILEAAGVERIFAPQLPEVVKLPPTSDPKARNVVIEDIIAQVRRIGLQPGTVPLFSAHQMGSCRMGVTPKESVVDPNCESWECKGLYVVDASTFPSASGVNPMITTLAIAHHAAQGLKQRLAQASNS